MENIQVLEDDVREAYFWILGRNASDAEIKAQLATVSRLDFRDRVFRSFEFLDQANQLQLLNALDSVNHDSEDMLPEDHLRTIVLDIPLCGTELIRRLVIENSPGAKLCPESANRLLLRNGLGLGVYDLFIGNFDRLSLRAIPGIQKRMVIMLANPRHRLVALYDHLKAYDDTVVTAGHMDLCIAAKKLDFADFLEEAYALNPGAIDNVYLRTLGGELSKNIWEGMATQSLPKALNEATCALYMQRAINTVDSAVVGFREHIDATRRLIVKALGLPGNGDVQSERHDDVVYQGRYNWLPASRTDSRSEDMITRLTLHDQAIYDKALERFLA